MTMRKASSPLASLLIISAIDLLVCCLTAGIMLFLVFQPSLRADRSSAVLNAERGSAGTFQVPVTIIVRNNGPNQLVASNSPPSGYEEIAGANASKLMKTRLYRAQKATPPVLNLGADNAAGRVSATIAVVANDKIITKTIDCMTGDQVGAEIDPAAEYPINITRCSAPTMCYHYAIVPAQTTPPTWAEVCGRRTDGGSLAEKFAAATRTCGFQRDNKRGEWVSNGLLISSCEPTPVPATKCQVETTEMLARRDVPLTVDACGVDP